MPLPMLNIIRCHKHVVSRIAKGIARARACSHVIAVVVVLFLATDLQAQPFTIEYKPPAPVRIGSGLSIAVDGSGNPHLAYNRDLDLNGSFRHAFKQGGTWHYGTVVDQASDYSSLAFNAGTLYGSYRDVVNSDARFATFNGSSWTTELVSDVFPDEGRYNSLTFDQTGSPHIAYFEGSGADNAIHAFPIGGGWLGELAAGTEPTRQGLYTCIALSAEDTIFISHVGVGTGGQDRIRLAELSGLDWGAADISPTLTAEGFATAIVVASTGQPRVAFVAGGGGGPPHVLYFASRNASMVWTITAIDTLGGSSDLAMRLDSAGQAHIIYRDAPALRHAYLDSVLGWRRETIDAPALGIGGDLDLAIDGSDILHVAYEVRIQWPTNLSTPVRYARGTFGTWTTEPVEGENQNEGTFLALTTTSTGLVVAAYYDAALGDVQVSRRDGGNNWTDDDIAEVGDVGRFVAMPVRTVALNTANVAYFDATNGTIVQRSGSYDAWNQTTVVAAVPALASLSYADSAGFGRVAYYDSAAGDVFLARLGPSGTSIVPVDQAGDVGRSCRIAVTTDGVTHIVYHDATVGRLRHARFVGGAWAYLNIATGPGIGRSCALASLGTAMGVAYYDAANGDLYSARWTGSGWLTNLVDATNDVGSACSAVIGVGNVIEIAYYDATAAQLKFAVVTDVGNVARVDVVDTGNVGRPNAITLEPTTHMAQIVYYDASRGFLKYALQQPGGVGVDEAVSLGSALIVSPSPARVGGSIRVSLSGGIRRIQRLALYDVRGRELSSSTLAGTGVGSVDLGVPASASGVLFVRAVEDNGRVSIGRIPVLR